MGLANDNPPAGFRPKKEYDQGADSDVDEGSGQANTCPGAAND